MGEKSIVAEWYKKRSIFMTGGTGYMGKVLVEKILYTCKDVEDIYILMRPKRGKSQHERLETILTIPLFERIRATNPEALKKIIPIDGDMSKEELGINTQDKKRLTENVSIVFHLGANLRLESELPEALEINTVGTKRVIELCRDMKKLVAFIHVSTAFCSADLDVFEEKVYDPPADPDEVLRTLKWINRDCIVKATSDLIKPHNTYTYTKRLAETLVAREASRMRVAIVRPSIVTPSGLDPFPGWVDSLNGAPGIIAAASKGVLRVMHCHSESPVHIVAVDIAISALIVVAWKLGSAAEQPTEVPVYNLTNDEVVSYKWFDILDLSKKIGRDYPFEWQVWYPNGSMCATYREYFIWSIFLHWLPAVFIDVLLFLLFQERIMIRVQKKIHNGVELLTFFTTKHWVFKSQNFLSLVSDLNAVDNELFSMDFRKATVEEYLSTCVLGTRHYCLKENPNSIPRCRIKQKLLYVVDKLFKLFLLYIIYLLAWSCFADCLYNFYESFT